jgi:hypothetical protein
VRSRSWPLGLAGIGAAAGGLGVAVLALQGFDKAIKALSTYELDPTIENLQKLRIEEEKLGPAGAEFLHFLDQLQPQLRTSRTWPARASSRASRLASTTC